MVNPVFFGTPLGAVFVLEELAKKNFLPSLVVTSPDKPKGRKMYLYPPEAKVWAEEHGIPVMQPDKLDDSFLSKLEEWGGVSGFDVFITAVYGNIFPQKLLELPRHGVLNVHPSLLPRLRGANPIRGAILSDEREVGVSIMLVDEEVDHGPILAQEKVEVANWPPRATELEELLLRRGGALLANTIPRWLSGEITPREQEHERATFSKKIRKEDGLIDLSADAYQNLLKIRAYEGWPGAYFFTQKNGKEVRVKITDATLEDGRLKLLRVIPEGAKEMDYRAFKDSQSNT